jgi:hypothetical protein
LNNCSFDEFIDLKINNLKNTASEKLGTLATESKNASEK